MLMLFTKSLLLFCNRPIHIRTEVICVGYASRQCEALICCQHEANWKTSCSVAGVPSVVCLESLMQRTDRNTFFSRRGASMLKMMITEKK